MSRLNENTVVQLPSQIGAPAAGRREYLPAASLQMICQVVYRPNIGPIWILHVAGGVDSRASEELLAKIERLLGVVHLSRLILDLGGVTHMDSSGVGALLACLRGSENQHVRFTLCGLPKPLHGMLERTRLSSLFETLPTVEEALRR
jgi:anti-anti-sigma factor